MNKQGGCRGTAKNSKWREIQSKKGSQATDNVVSAATLPVAAAITNLLSSVSKEKRSNNDGQKSVLVKQMNILEEPVIMVPSETPVAEDVWQSPIKTSKQARVEQDDLVVLATASRFSGLEEVSEEGEIEESGEICETEETETAEMTELEALNSLNNGNHEKEVANAAQIEHTKVRNSELQLEGNRAPLTRAAKSAHRFVHPNGRSSPNAVVKDWVHGNSLKFGCILETRVAETKCLGIAGAVFPGWSIVSNYEYNRLGRIWVVWSDEVKLNVIRKSEQMITCSVSLADQDDDFVCSFIYAANLASDRRVLWEEMKQIHDTGSLDFQEAVRYCGLVDMGFHGPWLTWSNKQSEGLVHQKLDRVMEFAPMVKEQWETSEELFHSTSVMYRLTKKLKNLKPTLRSLAKQRIGNLTKRVRESFDQLCNQQELNALTPSESGAQAESLAFARWEHLSELEEVFLKQKSKLHWLNVGDKYIKGEAERHFREFLTEMPAEYQGISTEELEGLLERKCSQAESASMIEEITDEEVMKVVFSMPNDKSLGPDGYTSEFFKGAWAIVGRDVIVAVQSFFRFSFLPKGVNSTILALIPNKNDAKTMKDYRPISCCNVLYKIISKILANRLKRVLPSLIAPNQSAFVQDRLLVENVLLASELVHDYHKDQGPSRCSMMIDIAKAFDTVQWSFLLNVLSAVGIPETFIDWIRICVSTASFRYK
ncbi:uncharacterized protein LOC112086111 [Eutrema salsugineum]|uniref:uncharacterized protein LOC112086111 n=1 Tax=Eutrema salsugineum TaxID=72664 RepID=UPI000CED36B9|nr:uncharacterized protein LOC112086111 [Eutrema salsugineum]